jgi:putative holliday junction resolvase
MKMMKIPTARETNSIVALDIGERRIGVAVASVLARLPRPLGVIERDAGTVERIQVLLTNEQAVAVVVGLPRGLDGQETQQTASVRKFIRQIKPALQVPVYWIDEALTSHMAKKTLERANRPYKKGDIDTLAACYILNDFLANHSKGLQHESK